MKINNEVKKYEYKLKIKRCEIHPKRMQNIKNKFNKNCNHKFKTEGSY